MAPQISPEFSSFRLHAGRSRIHRFGVFALEPIPRGRKVIEYTGQRITVLGAVRRARKLERAGAPRRVYLAQLSRRWIIDGSVGGSGAEFINHSCDPNLSHRRIRGHLFYFSRRRIRPGEELTLDYRFPRDLAKVPCHCGSPKCRGMMNRK